ncbi:hypothetical protein ACFX1Q_040996 [Malus domestica]
MNMAVLQFGKQNVPHEHDSAITTLRGEEEIDIELSELFEVEKRSKTQSWRPVVGIWESRADLVSSLKRPYRRRTKRSERSVLGKRVVSGSTTGRSKTKLGFGQKRSNAMDTKKCGS